MRFIDNLVQHTGTVRFAIFDGLSDKPKAQDIEAIRKRVEFFRNQGVIVIIFVPHVTAPYDPRRCYTRPLRASVETCTIGPAAREQIDRDFAPMIREISATEPNVYFFDQNEMFCDRTGCSFIRNGLPLFRDEYHYSEYGSAEVANRFVAWARQHVPGLLVAGK